MAHVLRHLVKSPAYTLVIIATLALGIGANTAIFSVANSVLLRPLPYDEPDRLMTIWEASQKQNFPKAPLPPGPFYDLRAQNESFAALAAWSINPLNLAGDGIEAERLEGAAVTADFTAVLRVDAARGRFFTPEEFGHDRDGVVILSHALWQQRFGGDVSVIGRPLQLNGRARTVVGIMPEGFNFPARTMAWIPYAPDTAFQQRRDWHLLRPVGRLKPGVTYDQARAELGKFARTFGTQYPDTDADWVFNAYPMLEDAVSSIRPALLLLIGAVAALLLIACANVANLLLVRAAARQQEIAVRMALGATRGRIVRQLLTETLWLFALGGVAGALLASWGLDLLLSLVPPNVPRVEAIAIDGTALWFTSLITLATGVAFGLAPAWQNSRGDLTLTLRTGDRGATAQRGRLRAAFVMIQVAAAVALLTLAGLLIRSFDQVRRVELGFNPNAVLTFRVDLPGPKFDSAEKSSRYIEELVRIIAAVPGVDSAGATTAAPLVAGPTFIMRFEGRPPVTPANSPIAAHRVVTNDYFRTIGARLIRGRWFGPQDVPGGPRVCVINQTLADRFFPREDPLGKRLEIGFDDPPAWREIVGIVGDMKSTGIDTVTPVQVFEPVHQWHVNSYSIAVRTRGNPAALAPAIRAAVQNFDRTQPVHTVKPMTQLVSESLAQRRFSVVLLLTFAGVALVLAVIGIYAVVAYSVAQRTREFGVRMALGATARDVVALVLREGATLALGGVVIGLALAAVLAQLVQTMLYGVGAHDPGTFAAIAALLGLVALAACLVPALRAARADPMTALRAE